MEREQEALEELVEDYAFEHNSWAPELDWDRDRDLIFRRARLAMQPRPRSALSPESNPEGQ